MNRNSKNQWKNRQSGPQENSAAFLEGYAPPHDEQLEKAVLGAVLQETSAVRTALGIIKSEDFFYKKQHRIIFRAISALFAAGTPIDILSVAQQLRTQGELEEAGGAYGVTELTGRVNSSANLETHIHYLLQMYSKRSLLQLSEVMRHKALDETQDSFELMNELSRGLNSTMDNLISKKPQSAAQVYLAAIEKIQSGIGKGGLVGVPSGITSIDRLTGGWHPGDLIIIAARPAMGKTACAIQYAKNAVLKFNKKVALFSLEMSNLQLMYRLIASESEFTNNELGKAQLSLDDLSELVIMSQCLQSQNLILDDTPGLSIMELRTKAHKLKADLGIDMIIVDYLQLMRGDQGGNREQEIGSISRGLKLIAKELNIPVIALAQLSRSVETRGGDKRPMLSDLRESGSIEQDADAVIFLYRPEYYGITEDEMGSPTAGTLQQIFAKHRNGGLDTITTKCDLAHNSITDLDPAWSHDFTPTPKFNPLPDSAFEEERPF